MNAVLLDLDGTLSDNFVGIARSVRYARERAQARPVRAMSSCAAAWAHRCASLSRG